MRHSLRAHILYLESTIRSVEERMSASDLSGEELEDLKLQLTLAESALEHYRRAYELELSVSGPEPPHHPDSQSNGGSGSAENGNGGRDKGGRSGSSSARRKRARAFAPLANVASARRLGIR